MQLRDLEQGSPEWHVWRQTDGNSGQGIGIGASETPAITGRSSYLSAYQLWAIRVGRAPKPDFSRNPHVLRGNRFEEAARQAAETHLQIGELKPACGESDQHSFIKASFDSLNPVNIPVELKCPCQSVWGSIIAKGWGSSQVLMYEAQVQHQLYVTGSRYGYLVFYNVWTREICAFYVARDDAFIAELVDQLLVMRDCILMVSPPKFNGEVVFQPDDNDAEWKREAVEVKRLIEQQRVIVAEAKIIAAELESKKAKMRSAMGSSLKADFFGIEVTRTLIKGRIGYKKYADALEQLVEPDQKPEKSHFVGKASERATIKVHTDLIEPIEADVISEASGFF